MHPHIITPLKQDRQNIYFSLFGFIVGTPKILRRNDILCAPLLPKNCIFFLNH